MSVTRSVLFLGWGVALLMAGCGAKIDGPTPAPVSVTSEQTGTNVICTCDAVEGCEKDKGDVLTLAGKGFAPLPVELLGDKPHVELPTVVFSGSGAEFVVDGAEPEKNPADVTVEYVDDATLIVKLSPAYVKEMPVGKYAVRVLNPNGTRSELPDALEVVLPPVLESIDPVAVCSEIDTVVKLKGKDFREGATVRIAEEELYPGDVKFIDASNIEITVRKGHEVGRFDVTVINPEGCASTLEQALTVNPPPTLESIGTPEVCSGGTITLTGTGFLPGATVTIGDADVTGAAVTVADDGNTLTATIGAVAPGGPYDVTVTNADGCFSETLAAALTVTPGPVAAAVDPNVVYNKVNFPVTIFGQGFSATTTVSVGTDPPTPATVTAAGDKRIDVVIPAGIAPGTYDLIIQSEDCTSPPVQIQVTDQLTVAICGIDPPFGWTGEQTPVTITSGTGAGCSEGTQTFASTPRVWLNSGGDLTALRAVAFVTAETLTGIVPINMPVGPYDVLVQNPDGGIGLLSSPPDGAFRVVDQQVPLIESLTPGSVDTQFVGTIGINGKYFRDPVTVELLAESGAMTTLTSPTVNAGGTQITAGLDVGTMGLATGAYVVRVTNTDQMTYSDFSSLAITNPSGNLGAWSAASAMVTARRRHALASGRVSNAARFLYALGGDNGTDPQAVVDVGPLDKFGGTGDWFVQRYGLAAGRTATVGFAQGSYIYVLGGEVGGAPVDTIERAMILDPNQVPQVATFTYVLGGNLGKGAWYYRIAAVLDPADPANAGNPGGETLPSEPIVIRALEGAEVTLEWTAPPGVGNVLSYSVYRTPTADLAIGQEQLLADGIPPTTLSYTDDGGAIKDAAITPLKLGATGVFVTLPTKLTGPRAGAALRLARAGGTQRVYLAGGRGSGGAVLASVEFADISDDGITLGAFGAAATALPGPRDRPILVAGESDTSPKIPAGTTYLFTVGGTDGTGGGGAEDSGASCTLDAAGNTSAWSDVTAVKKGVVAGSGWMIIDTLFWFGGSDNGTAASTQSFSCKFTNPPNFVNCNSLGPAALPAARMNTGLALESAYFYLSGGGATNAEATTTVFKTVY